MTTCACCKVKDKTIQELEEGLETMDNFCEGFAGDVARLALELEHHEEAWDILRTANQFKLSLQIELGSLECSDQNIKRHVNGILGKGDPVFAGLKDADAIIARWRYLRTLRNRLCHQI